MRALLWLSRFALFVLLFGFAMKNTELVSVRFFLGMSWQTPLILVVLLSFVLGAALAVASLLRSLLDLRREVNRLEHELEAALPTSSRRLAGNDMVSGEMAADGEIGR